jgi:hypothetical protein
MRIAIIVPCTASKRVPAGGLHLGQVAGRETAIERRFDRWQAAIAAAGTVATARDLYAGPRWQASLRVADAASGPRRNAEVFVASAGLGLVRASKPVPSYSATFSRGSADAVFPAGLSRDAQREATRRWWGLLTRHPRLSLKQLVRRYERVAIVLSPDYLDAVRDDLAAALGSGYGNVIVFGTGSPTHVSLQDVWVRVGRHLRETTETRPLPVINGLDATLLQSTAALVLRQPAAAWSSASKVQRFLDELADPEEITIEARSRADRRPSNDDEVRAFIRERIDQQDQFELKRELPKDLLEAWREVKKRRCQMERFKRLYNEVVAVQKQDG